MPIDRPGRIVADGALEPTLGDMLAAFDPERHGGEVMVRGAVTVGVSAATVGAAPPSRSDAFPVVDELRLDPAYAAAYVQSVLRDGGLEDLQLCLRRIAEAFIPHDMI